MFSTLKCSREQYEAKQKKVKALHYLDESKRPWYDYFPSGSATDSMDSNHSTKTSESEIGTNKYVPLHRGSGRKMSDESFKILQQMQSELDELREKAKDKQFKEQVETVQRRYSGKSRSSVYIVFYLLSVVIEYTVSLTLCCISENTFYSVFQSL